MATGRGDVGGGGAAGARASAAIDRFAGSRRRRLRQEGRHARTQRRARQPLRVWPRQPLLRRCLPGRSGPSPRGNAAAASGSAALPARAWSSTSPPGGQRTLWRVARRPRCGARAGTWERLPRSRGIGCSRPEQRGEECAEQDGERSASTARLSPQAEEPLWAGASARKVVMACGIQRRSMRRGAALCWSVRRKVAMMRLSVIVPQSGQRLVRIDKPDAAVELRAV